MHKNVKTVFLTSACHIEAIKYLQKNRGHHKICNYSI